MRRICEILVYLKSEMRNVRYIFLYMHTTCKSTLPYPQHILKVMQIFETKAKIQITIYFDIPFAVLFILLIIKNILFLHYEND